MSSPVRIFHVIYFGVFYFGVLNSCSFKRTIAKTEYAFVISGQIQELRVPTLIAQESKRATHVVGVLPAYGGTERRIIEINPDGSFQISLSSPKPWGLFFVDSSLSGYDMLISVFQMGDLLVLPLLESSGELNLGKISLNASSRRAHSDRSSAEILEDLGEDLSESLIELQTLGEHILRYSNPDLDLNGTLDAQEKNKGIYLDYLLSFRAFISGQSANISSVVNQQLFENENFSLDYASLNVLGHWSWALDLTADYVDANDGSLKEGVSLKINDVVQDGLFQKHTLTASHGFSKRVIKNQPLPPGGLYSFASSAGLFVFHKTQPLNPSELLENAFIPIPFIRLSPDLSSFSYNWRVLDAEGKWVKPSLDFLKISVGNTARVRFSKSLDSQAQNAQFILPTSSLENSVLWNGSQVQTLAGISIEDFESLEVNDLCSIEVDYSGHWGLNVVAYNLLNPSCE